MTKRMRLYQRLNEQARARELKALELRTAGLTFEAIGARLGVSKQAAHLMVQRANVR